MQDHTQAMGHRARLENEIDMYKSVFPVVHDTMLHVTRRWAEKVHPGNEAAASDALAIAFWARTKLRRIWKMREGIEDPQIQTARSRFVDRWQENDEENTEDVTAAVAKPRSPADPAWAQTLSDVPMFDPAELAFDEELFTKRGWDAELPSILERVPELAPNLAMHDVRTLILRTVGESVHQAQLERQRRSL